MTIDLTTRKFVTKPVWTLLVGRPVNSHVSRDLVMDIFQGKIIMYIIRYQGCHGSQGVPWGLRGSQGVPTHSIGREACELPRVSGPCEGHFPR